MKTKYLLHKDLLSPDWKISERLDFKGKFTIYEKNSSPIILIFVQPFTSIIELANCKTALQNSSVAMIWLIKEGFSHWSKQNSLENGDSSRCYFYKYDSESKKIEVFDKRKIPKPSGGVYITHPFSIDLKIAYFNQDEFVGVEGDFAYRRRTNKPFAKAIEKRLHPKPKRKLKSFFSAASAKALLQQFYLILLHKLEG